MTSVKPRILIVDDETNVVKTLAKILERRGYEVTSAGDGAMAIDRLEEGSFDLVITDLKMPRLGGMELLRSMHDRGIESPVIVLTGYGTVQTAVEAMKLGATDYLIKPCNPEELLLIVSKELENRNLRLENRRLRDEVRRQQRFGSLVGNSPTMIDLYRMVDAVSRNKSNVLVIGESGTGKELVARTIHQRSLLAEKPLLAVNCAGMSETLIDSQLFGHRRGSFTGATDDHEGMFQAATGGTLFLDEVYEIPLSLQAKFLRAIQEREVTPLGSNKPVPVDVRIIAATNHDLETAVQKGTFRSDLYYRLNVVTLHLPSLGERKGDLPILIEHFSREFGRVYGIAPKTFTDAALVAMEAYGWPGNVRELQNSIERAFALSQSHTIDVDDLPPAVTGRVTPVSPSALTFEDLPTLEEAENMLVSAALSQSEGNKTEAARILGIDRQRLYRKMKKFGFR